jgi:hypothetical protein
MMICMLQLILNKILLNFVVGSIFQRGCHHSLGLAAITAPFRSCISASGTSIVFRSTNSSTSAGARLLPVSTETRNGFFVVPEIEGGELGARPTVHPMEFP